MADTILHNQPIGTPSDSERIAYGTPTTPSGNITLANFYTLLMTKLGFFKVSNYFSEIFGNPTAMASARANLSVPSVLEMQTADGLKANKSNVIEKDSTATYTPTLSTHPVNVGWVNSRRIVGTFQYDTPWSVLERTVNIGQTLNTNNYSVLLESATPSGFKGMYPLIVKDKTNSTFVIQIDPENTGIMEQPLIRWTILL